MAIMAPEVAVAGAGAAAAGEAAKQAGEMSDRLEGSTVSFMLAIVLLGGALIALWLAFHNPSEWDSEQWPGLAGRVIQWAQSNAEKPGILGGGSAGSESSSASGQSALANAYGATERALKAGNLLKLPIDALTTVGDALAKIGKALGL